MGRKKPIAVLRCGKVLRVYPSVGDAAKGESVSPKSITYWCTHRAKGEYNRDGVVFRYLKEVRDNDRK